MDFIDNIPKPINLKFFGNFEILNNFYKLKIKLLYIFINEFNKNKGQIRRNYELYYNNDIYLKFSVKTAKGVELVEKLNEFNNNNLIYGNKPFMIIGEEGYDCKVYLKLF